jgi:DNA (cytosine-5)-methyltransferase 1
MENVKNLVGEKHKHNFIRWLRVLEMMGYWNFWQVLNAKDYGVPQNRERVFVVSILGGGQYLFPNKIKLEKRLKDILEPYVDGKYYISDEFARYIEKKCEKEHNFRVEVSNPNEIRNTPLKSSGDKPCVIVPEATKQGYAEAYDGDSINLDQPNSETRRGRVGHQMANTLTCACNQAVVIQEPFNLYPNTGNPQAGRVYNAEGISPAMDTCSGGNRMPKIMENYRIRKLTPRECWRLMGVRDGQYDKLHDISNTQLYKMAGNSIVVDVLMGIFKNLFLSDEGTSGQLTLF